MHDFGPLLWRALWDADLFSVPELYGRCQATIQERGRAEREFLVARIGETAWRRVLAAWGQPETEQQAVKHLGFGAVMTEFFVAPVSLPDAERAAVVHLGTLVNLLAGVYDDVVDAGTVQDPLPRRALQALLLGQKVSPEDAAPMVALADEYFRQLDALTNVGAHPKVLRTLRRAILKMHAAERTTLAGNGSAARLTVWRRKTGLPFVVMALPAWLTVSSVSPPAYYHHLRWLYLCAEFWGWVDDAVDMADDTATGHPNQIAEALARDVPRAVAERIAGRGRGILADWRRMTPQAADLPLVVQEALPSCLFAALGHSLSQTRKEVNA